MALKLVINAIGKVNEAGLIDLNKDYIKRIKWKIEINEFTNGKNPDVATNKRQEALKLLPANVSNAYIFALDEKGTERTSQQFAQHMINLRNNGISTIYFLLGGADGIDQSVKTSANEVISLSKLTLPHKLARLILIEQIYRAYTIDIQHPYHRGA